MQLTLPDGRTIEVRGLIHEANIPVIAGSLKWTGYENWPLPKVAQYIRETIAVLKIAQPVSDVLSYSEGDEDYYNWVVPDLFEGGDRLVLTGAEGTGKSTLIMQWLTQISAGIHPITGEDIKPQPVLLIDLEYGMNELARRLLRFEALAGDKWNPDNFRVISKPEGWDLLVPENREQLMSLMEIWQPSVIGISPLYKSFTGDETDDVVASRVTDVLNELRDYDTVLITEAHVPHAGPSGRRPERPIGSSVWTRWPEFGIFLGKNGELRHFRGPRDAEREWPAALKRGGKWPWTALDPEKGEDLRWRKLYDWAAKNNRKPTTRQAAEILGVAQTTATRVMKGHENDWPALG